MVEASGNLKDIVVPKGTADAAAGNFQNAVKNLNPSP